MLQQAENHTRVLIETVEDPSSKAWTVHGGDKPEIFNSWHAAYDTLVDHVKYWFGYYSEQLERAKERGLTTTQDIYREFISDYDEWLEYLKSVEDEPKQIYLIGGQRKLSISARDNSEDNSS